MLHVSCGTYALTIQDSVFARVCVCVPLTLRLVLCLQHIFVFVFLNAMSHATPFVATNACDHIT